MAQRILIVDDVAGIRFALSQYFTEVGYRVDAAATLPQADAFLAQNWYHLVLADLSLGATFDTQGLDLIRLLRTRPRYTAVILLTAYGSDAIEAEARRCGADSVLLKSVGLAVVAAEVARLIGAPGEGHDDPAS